MIASGFDIGSEPTPRVPTSHTGTGFHSIRPQLQPLSSFAGGAFETSGGSVVFVGAPPGAHPMLRDDEVHLWCVPLAATESRVAKLSAILSPDEIDRADRFRCAEHRRRYILARGMLRELLGQYLTVPSQDVALTYSSFGKPRLAESLSNVPLRFNVAHSGDLALYGMTLGRELGVDVEVLVRQRDFRGIGDRFFSPHERLELRRTPERNLSEAFYSCWTRKEAFLKATGQGMSDALDSFEVTLKPGEPAALLRADSRHGDLADWCLRDFRPRADAIGALAMPGRDLRVLAWRRDC